VGSFQLSHAALIAIGAFYTFAGLVGMRVALQGRLVDIAMAGLLLEKTPAVEIARGLWLLFASAGVLAGGLFLIVRLDWAAAAFAISALAQALYLLGLAPLVFDRADPPDAKGRQQTINAFILYAAATLFVLWALRTGKLLSADAVGWPPVFGTLAVLGAALAWGLFRFVFPLAKGPMDFLKRRTGADPGADADPLPEDEPGPPLSESRRILLMSDYECEPLWTHDPGRSGMIAPGDLPLSEALIADLNAWARSYDGSFNFDDFDNPHWSEAQYKAHDEAGIALARRLKRELPDREIYVWRLNDGKTEISDYRD